MNETSERAHRIDAVLFDFVGVVASVRMAVAGDEGTGNYVIVLNEPVVASIRNLRNAGVKTAVITNNDRRALQRQAPNLRLDEMFDVDVFSSDIGVSKPDPRIFTHALNRLEVPANRAAFLDDLANNVDAAISMGMRGVVVDRVSTAVDAVESIIANRR